MTTKQKAKIHNLESLIAEKSRLAGLCRNKEDQLEQRIDYIRENYPELIADHIILPAIKKTFNFQNILHILNLDELANIFSGNGNKNNNFTNGLKNIFGRTGWIFLTKILFSLLKKFTK